VERDRDRPVVKRRYVIRDLRPVRERAPAAAAARPVDREKSREERIAEAAYYIAERRAFRGDPVRDWLEAEREIDSSSNVPEEKE
jgi:hypothetical protein